MKEIENDILKRYVSGAPLRTDDNPYVIGRLKNIGLLRCGFDVRIKDETVRTTELGKDLLRSRGISFDQP
ncbi:MAG: hypothetical protein FWD92_05670 [Methanomassiliicoccaceae archaeon]|nr:hypothetical protein [Methanomassiliicoccaceae archaeon]